MKAFLSSTYLDLIDHRDAVSKALELLGQRIGRMEVMGARSEEAASACLREIEDCDIFVGIYAHRYGFIPERSTTSITEQEFHHAKRVGIPCFCFVIDSDYSWPPRMIDHGTNRDDLLKFIQLVKAQVIVDTFDSPPTLALKVQSAILHFLIKGSQSAYFNQEGEKQIQRWGEALATTGKWHWESIGRAGEHFLQAVKLDPENQDPWTNLAYTYHLIGDTRKSNFCITKSYEISPSTTQYKGDKHRRVADAIKNDTFRSGGKVNRPQLPDWFSENHENLFRYSVIFSESD